MDEKPTLPDPLLVKTVAPAKVIFLKFKEFVVEIVPFSVEPEGAVAVNPPVNV